MTILLIIALGGAVVWLTAEFRQLRGQLTALERRLTTQEVLAHTAVGEQNKLADEWAAIFGSQQAAWNRHVEKITNEVTLQLALGSNQRGRVRR